MTRWYVGVTPGGRREVFADATGTDPAAAPRGYADVFGPYRTEREALTTAKSKPSPERGTPRNRRRS